MKNNFKKMKKTIEITKEQAVELLKTTPAFTDIIYENFPELKPKKRWFEEYKGKANFHIIKNKHTDFNVNISLVDAYHIQGFRYNEQAQEHAKKLNLYTEMQVFANFRNGDWVADWNDYNQSKFGISICRSSIIIEEFTYFYGFIFQIAVKNKEIAQEMLEEFGDRIKECFGLK